MTILRIELTLKFRRPHNTSKLEAKVSDRSGDGLMMQDECHLSRMVLFLSFGPGLLGPTLP